MNNRSGNIYVGSDSFGGDTGDMDLGPGADVDAQIDGGDVPTQDADTGEDSAHEPTDLCSRFEDLGQMDADATQTVTGSLSGGADGFTLECGTESAPEKIYRMEFAGPARVELSISSAVSEGFRMQVMHGACDEAQQLVCFERSSEVFLAEGGKPYYLLVESEEASATAEFSLAFESTPLGCFPFEEAQCAGDDITYCEPGGNEVSLSCARPCASNACGGDTCANATTVSGTGTFDFGGSSEGYFDDFDFAGQSSCFESGRTRATPGTDYVYHLTGLESGQTVIVDASDEVNDIHDNAIFVLRSCGDYDSCVAGDEQITDLLEWEVPSAGDYFVVVDQLSSSIGDFAHRITIQ